MSNILKGIIVLEAKGVAQTTSQVAASVAKVETGFKKLVPASNQATNSLTNLGRVVQDAPFGFIGIANNLNPLLESFQRLKQTTGTTGGALKALTQELRGPAGLGFALSVASSLVLAFGDKIGRLFTGRESEQTKAFKDSLESFSKAAASASVSVTEVKLAFEGARQGLLGKDQALKLYNDTLGESLGKTNSLAEAEKLLAEKAEAYIKITGLKAQANALFAKSAELSVNALLAQNELERSGALNKGGIAGRAASGFEGRLEKARKDAAAIQSLGEGLLRQAAVLAKENKINIAPEIKLDKAKTAKAIKDGLKPFEQIDVPVDKVTLRPESLLIPNFKDVVLGKEAEKTLAEQMNQAITDAMSKNVKNPNLSVAFDKNILDETLRQGANLQNLASIVQGSLTPAFEGFFDALASGGNALKSLFQGIGDAIKGLLVKLASTAAIAGILSLIPGVGAALGFSDGFGSIFKGLLGFRASGGAVGAGQPYMVGENRPELFIPNVGGRIVSNPGAFSGGGFGGRVVFEISGDRLIGVLANGNRSQGRLR